MDDPWISRLQVFKRPTLQNYMRWFVQEGVRGGGGWGRCSERKNNTRELEKEPEKKELYCQYIDEEEGGRGGEEGKLFIEALCPPILPATPSHIFLILKIVHLGLGILGGLAHSLPSSQDQSVVFSKIHQSPSFFSRTSLTSCLFMCARVCVLCVCLDVCGSVCQMRREEMGTKMKFFLSLFSDTTSLAPSFPDVLSFTSFPLSLSLSP